MSFNKRFMRAISCILMVLILIPSQSFAGSFKDVDSKHWAYSYIEEMAKLKYINGYEDGTYKPKGTLTYLETLKLLSNLLDMTSSEKTAAKASYEKTVKDLGIPEWAQESVINCLYKGVISEAELKDAGSKGLLKTGTNLRINRLVISVYMAKAMGLEAEANAKPFVSLNFKDLSSIDAKYHKLIYILVEKGVLSANGTGNGYFEPSSPLLREQMAKMLSEAHAYLEKNPQTPSPTTPPTSSTESIEGIITSINKIGNNTFVNVQSGSSKSAAYLVDSSTVIKLDGKTDSIGSIMEGQEVKLTITKGTSNVLTLEAETFEDEIEGKIKNVSSSNNKLTVEYERNKQTKTIDLIVDKNTDITLNGVEAALKDLVAGDEVIVLIEGSKVIEIDATSKYGEVEGIIVALDTETEGKNKVNYITIENSKKVKTEYKVSEDADIYRDGERVEFKDLRIGDEAVIELENGIAVDIEADIVELELEGTIVGITARLNSAMEITIRDRQTGEEKTYTVARNPIIRVDNNRNSSVLALNVGYFVEAVVGGNELTEIYADSIGAESFVVGRITSVNTRRSEVKVNVMNSDIIDYKYGEEATITLSNAIISKDNKTDLGVGDISRGDSVTILGNYDGYTFTASQVIIRR